MLIANNEYLTQGFVFHSKINKGVKTAVALRQTRAETLQCPHPPAGAPEPSSEFEIKLLKTSRNTGIENLFDSVDGNPHHKLTKNLFDGTSYGSEPNLFRVALATISIRRQEGEIFLYYFMLGMVVGNAWRHKFCKCCGWRIVNPRNPVNCHSCMYIRGKSTTSHARQSKIFTALKQSAEYEAFMQVRHRGLDYPVLLAVGQAPPPKGKLACDDLDETADAEYRERKTTLALLWAAYQPNSRVRQAKTTEEKLLELAKIGYNKAQAAKVLNITRAGVTKACKRNDELENTFRDSQISNATKAMGGAANKKLPQQF